ncbi:hypothetical protein PV328_011794 [Microctonus aethiopoides]|uniref:Uncharacterized protein n=1 Tax=Microctonus aethiopoides TaxID=144406 RepID=A0AA39FHD6_9HYME|nr:hypothetical protein PV328_011794 [Microctonus aethiopoides]
MRIGRLREEEMNEYGRKVCPRCKCVKKSDATIIIMMENLIYFANQLKSRLRSMMSKVEELSGKKLVNNAVNDDDDDDDDEDDKGHDVAGNESPMSLQDVKQKEKEEKNSDTNNQKAPTTATAVTSDDEKIIYIMRLLIVFMMDGAERNIQDG